jgi:hypothetical protein
MMWTSEYVPTCDAEAVALSAMFQHHAQGQRASIVTKE